MDYRILGRTGLKVSVMGIGAGGPSRLGQRNDVNTESESVDIVLQALDAGVNFIDTAEVYGTETIVGKALAQRNRDNIIISTKKSTWNEQLTPENVRNSVEDSLGRLQTDYIDIYHMHGLKLSDYDHCINEIMPVLHQLQEEGKIRFIGVTEAFNSDKDHSMLQRAMQDDVWDVMMIGFNLLNQSARETVLLPAIEKQIGTLIMFAVRRALSSSERLAATVQELINDGQIDPDAIDVQRPLAELIETGIATGIPDLAYRFCREEPGTHVILSGTSNPAHLQANLETFERPTLSPEVIERLTSIFKNVTSVTGE